MPARVLVFGSTGQLGGELRRATWSPGIEVASLDRAAADLSRPAEAAATVRRLRPAAIVVAAAYTAVDRAEDEEALAFTINADAPAAIAAAAAEIGAPIVYPSTDYVFDGAKPGRYVETDPVSPINAYGRSKLAGEERVRDANPRHLILRTSWVYSARGTNFVRTMLRLAETRDEVSVVADQHGCPTAAGDLAAAIARIMPRVLAGDAAWGAYHLAGTAETSWHGFADAIFSGLAERRLRRPRLTAIASRDYRTKARRPANGSLSSERFRAVFGMALPGYLEALPGVLDEALSTVAA